jgi:hypothetical protein
VDALLVAVLPHEEAHGRCGGQVRHKVGELEERRLRVVEVD